MPTVGTVIAGKYELASLLGRGSMGEVWVAHHLSLGEDVALKLLASTPTSDIEDASKANARFRFEAQIAAHLSRKTRHIVRVTDHGEEDGVGYLVMELLDGQTLEARLMRRGCFLPADAPKLIAQIARALTEAHGAGVIHRDLKPANVFVTRDEDGALLVKLLDFGIARTVHTHRVSTIVATGPGLIFGTPGYMSPEQASPISKLDHRCDLWALATVAYEALTSELPVAGAYTEELLGNLRAGHLIPVRERDPRLPAALDDFFARAFARNIDDRYASASELAQAFEAALGEAGVDAYATTTPGTLKGHTLPLTPPGMLHRRSDSSEPAQSSGTRTWLIALASAAVLVGLAALGVAWRSLGGSTPTSAMGPPTPHAELLSPLVDAPIRLPTPALSTAPHEPSPPVTFAPLTAVASSASPAPVAARPAGPMARTPKDFVAAPAPAASQTKAAPLLVPAQAPLPAPAPSPSPSPQKPINRSEVL